MTRMFATIKQLLVLALNTKKIWLIPLFLLFVIVALLVVSAQIAPVPLFIYPLI